MLRLLAPLILFFLFFIAPAWAIGPTESDTLCVLSADAAGFSVEACKTISRDRPRRPGPTRRSMDLSFQLHRSGDPSVTQGWLSDPFTLRAAFVAADAATRHVHTTRADGAVLIRLPGLYDPKRFVLEIDGRPATAAAFTKTDRVRPAAAAQPVETLIDNGPVDNRLDLVVLGDGYTAGEQGAFRQDALALLDYWLAQEPFQRYAIHYNVHLLFIESAESGADHPSQGIQRDTAFDASFDYADIPQLLVVDEAKVLRAALAAPDVDQVVVIVNDDMYGGSGGSVAVVSRHLEAPEVMTHELGHSLANLADEYEDPLPGYEPGDSEPNVTFETERDAIPWVDWIEPAMPLPSPEEDAYAGQVGLFEGARYRESGIYRPELTCRMRELGRDFCTICREALVAAHYRHLAPSDALGGDVVADVGETLFFDAAPVQPESETVSVVWTVDGLEQEARVEILEKTFEKGLHTVTAQVVDSSDWLRLPAARDTAHADITWTVHAGIESSDGDSDAETDEELEQERDAEASNEGGDTDLPAEDGDTEINEKEGNNGGGCRSFPLPSSGWILLIFAVCAYGRRRKNRPATPPDR